MLLAPGWYTARLSVMSVKRPAGLMPQSAELRELGLPLPGGGGDAERVAAVLSSDSVSDAVVDKFDLKTRYGQKSREAMREELWEHCGVRVLPRSEVVVLTCEDKDPAVAQAMAAFFGEHGNAVFRRVDSGSAAEEVKFLEAHLSELREQGRQAQQRLRTFEEQNKIVDLDSQAKAVVSAIAALRSQRVQKELELAYAKGFTSREEATAVQLRRVLAVLQEKERALGEAAPRPVKSASNDNTVVGPEGDLFPAAVAVPSLRAQLQELQLDRKFYETAELMTMQRLETARANQARDVSTFQVLDAPSLPNRRSRPRRPLIAALGALVGLLAGAAWVFGPAYLRSLREA